MSFKTSEFRVLASGLEYPEGPVYRADGSVLVVEIHKGTLTRVAPDGTDHHRGHSRRRSERSRGRAGRCDLRLQ